MDLDNGSFDGPYETSYIEEASIVDDHQEQEHSPSIYGEEEPQLEGQDVSAEQELPQEETEAPKPPNLKSETEAHKSIREEIKRIIFLEKEHEIKNAALSSRRNEIYEINQSLKRRIEEAQRDRRRKLRRVDHKYNQLIEVQNCSTFQLKIASDFKQEVERCLQRIDAIKQSNIVNEIKREYENSEQLIRKKLEERSMLIKKLKDLKLNFKKKNDEVKTEGLNLKKHNSELKKEISNNKEKLNELDRTYDVIGDEMKIIEQTLKEKDEEELEILETLKKSKVDIDSQREQQLENVKNFSLMKMKLEFEHETLLKRSDTISAKIKNLKEEIEKKEAKNKDLEEKYNSFPVANEMIREELEGITVKELEQTLANLKMKTSIRDTESELSKNYQELKEQNSKDEMNSFKIKHAHESLEKEISILRTTFTDNNNKSEILRSQIASLRDENKKKFEEIETQRRLHESMKQKEEQLKMYIEELGKDLAERKDDFNRKNELHLSLEKETIQRRHELSKIENTNASQKEADKEADAQKIKKLKQYTYLRKMYLQLSNSINEETSQEHTQSTEEDALESQNRCVEVVEDENTENKISPKGILKSPFSSAPTTPTKNVTFVGVASTESSSSIEVVDAKQPLKQTNNFVGSSMSRRSKFD